MNTKRNHARPSLTHKTLFQSWLLYFKYEVGCSLWNTLTVSADRYTYAASAVTDGNEKTPKAPDCPQKDQTNEKRALLVGVIGQLCGIFLKGQALANVQKNLVTQGYLWPWQKHFCRSTNREAWLDWVEGKMGSNRTEAASIDIYSTPEKFAYKEVERNMALTRGKYRLNWKFCLLYLFLS